MGPYIYIYIYIYIIIDVPYDSLLDCPIFSRDNAVLLLFSACMHAHMKNAYTPLAMFRTSHASLIVPRVSVGMRWIFVSRTFFMFSYVFFSRTTFILSYVLFSRTSCVHVTMPRMD